jgi:hypothetical protein
MWNYRMNNSSISLTFAAVLLLSFCAPGLAFQKKGGRELLPKTTPEPKRQGAARRGSGGAGRTSADATGGVRKPASSGLSLNVTPSDSTIVFDGGEYRAENGAFARTAIKPGAYKVVVRREGYREKEYEVELEAGRVTSASISLEALRGTLTVNPTVANAEISILSIDTNALAGKYVGRASSVELPPGHYQVFVSKEGYKTAVREVALKHSQALILEPLLEILPKPPAPTRRAAQSRTPQQQFRPDSVMQTQTSFDGKFVVLMLTGRSGDTSNAFGALDVTLSRSGQAWSANVSGLLTGHPCRVDFVRLENVAEYSFAEPPGAANQWGRAVLRIRPKDSKRPIRFMINWKGL